jgi:phage gp16-like protein
MDAFKAKGFKIRRAGPAKAKSNPGTRRMASDPQSKLIRHLWLRLHGIGVVRDPSEEALAHYVEGQTKVADLHWLDNRQASTIIEALKSWIARVEDAK